MTKNTYHHGKLKEAMIAKGLRVLNQEGYEALSLRKVAALCRVSHAAPYKHFKNKEELLLAIKAEVLDKFKRALEAAAAKSPDDPLRQMIELGKCYVKFMVDNPDYLKFLASFRQYDQPLITNNQLRTQDQSEVTFNIFTQSALNYLRSVNPHLENPTIDILAMWSVVHGLAVLIANKSIVYAGNYLELVEKILGEKLKLG